jgi:predicted transposase/invertase (TIGR01784 family)
MRYVTTWERRGMERGMQQGIEKGKRQEKYTLIVNMHKNGISIEQISKMTNMSVKDVKNIVNQTAKV